LARSMLQNCCRILAVVSEPGMRLTALSVDAWRSACRTRGEEHRSMMEWLGGKYDPKGFDVGETNRFLAMLKWPRTSVTHLGRVIEARLEEL
jgi:hypothetical protein